MRLTLPLLLSSLLFMHSAMGMDENNKNHDLSHSNSSTFSKRKISEDIKNSPKKIKTERNKIPTPVLHFWDTVPLTPEDIRGTDNQPEYLKTPKKNRIVHNHAPYWGRRLIFQNNAEGES